MEANKKLPLIDVTIVTKDICELITGDEYTSLKVPVQLKDNNKLKDYTCIIICEKDDEENAKNSILESDGINKEDFKLDKKYCHITTYETNKKSYKISFDMNEDFSVKADINKEYSLAHYFFESFINFRNNLIKNNQVVKHDDIYQYYLSVFGYTKQERNSRVKKRR